MFVQVDFGPINHRKKHTDTRTLLDKHLVNDLLHVPRMISAELITVWCVLWSLAPILVRSSVKLKRIPV